MIKLIVSDVDGTLVFDDASDKINRISPKMFQLIGECKKRDVIFGVASGRTNSNLKKTFLPVWRDAYFLAENGNAMFYKNELIRKMPIPTNLVREIVEYTKTVPNFGVNFTTPHKMMMFEEPEWFSKMMIYEVKNATILIDDLEEVFAEDIMNISTYSPIETIDQLDADFREKFGDRLKITKSGAGWIDFALSGKGAAVRFLMDNFGIQKDEVMVFGDNFNDIEMFSAAKYSFAMEKADPQVKAKANYTTSSVEAVIEEYFNSGKIESFSEKQH